MFHLIGVMRHRRPLRIGLAVLLAVMVGCSGKAQTPAFEATFVVEASRHAELVALLDTALTPLGLTRVGAAPGLKELTGREVLFAAYEKPGSSIGALDLTDVKRQGSIEVFVYTELFPDHSKRAEFLAAVDAAINPFGGKLAPSSRGK